MKNLKKALLHSVLIALVSTGLITFFPENPTSQASTQKPSVSKKTRHKKQLASISGVIIDEQGAVIGGVTVSARHLATNTLSETITKEDGSYILSNLKHGLYEVTAQAPGFTLASINNVRLSVSFNTKVNLTLKVASTADIVEVIAQSVVTQGKTQTYGNTQSHASVRKPSTNSLSFKGKRERIDYITIDGLIITM